jgi:hypothetical protein
MPIVSTAMSESLRDRLDQFATDHGYGGRSEVMREACRSLLDAYETDDGGDEPLVATVTAVFGYDRPDVERRMMGLATASSNTFGRTPTTVRPTTVAASRRSPSRVHTTSSHRSPPSRGRSTRASACSTPPSRSGRPSRTPRCEQRLTDQNHRARRSIRTTLDADLCTRRRSRSLPTGTASRRCTGNTLSSGGYR